MNGVRWEIKRGTGHRANSAREIWLTKGQRRCHMQFLAHHPPTHQHNDIDGSSIMATSLSPVVFL